MFRNKYRIVRDDFAGYEVQIKRWWWPFWTQCYYTNTSNSIDEAKKVIDNHRKGLRENGEPKNRVVEYIN